MTEQQNPEGGDQFNPADHTVQEVNDYLASADEAERQRVLSAEQSGDSRKGILEGPYADATDASSASGGSAGTEGQEDVSSGLQEPYTGLPEGTETRMSVIEANAVAVKGEGDFTANTPEEVLDAGYYGTSPGRELTGLPDKGLSQQSILGETTGQVVQPVQEAPMPEGQYDPRTGAFTPAPPSEGGTKADED